jgi:hypothetical protein
MYARPLIAATAVILLLAGCAQASNGAGAGDEAAAPATVDIRGEWLLTDGNAADGPLTVPDFALTAVFTDGSARIRTGCFAYDVSMTQELDVQTASLITRDANPSASCMAMDPELDAAVQSLGDVTGASRDGDLLVLTGPDLELDFALVPAVASADLEGSWTLTSILMSDVAMGVENGPTFVFADGAVSGKLHCDNYTGSLTPVSGNNTITDLKIEPSGDMCTMEVREEVEELTALLKTTFVVHVSDESIELVSSTDDRRFTFMPSA